MKMPRVEIGAVQSLGRHDTAAVAATGRQAAATGQQQQQMMSLMAGVAGDYIQRQQDVEYNNAVADTQTQINNFERHHLAKRSYTSDEVGSLPTDMVPRTTTTFVNGERVETPREDIPAYEVYPHLLKQELEGMTEVNAEKISNPVLRKEYLNMAQIKNSEMMMSAGIQAEQQQQAFVFAKGVADADTAFNSGDFMTGAFHVSNLDIDDNVKEKLMKKGGHDVEVYEVGQAAASTDQEFVMTMRSRYNAEHYEGDLNPNEAKMAVADLDAQLTRLGLEGVQDKQEQQDIRDNNRLYSATLGNMRHEEVEAGYELWQINKNAKGAISVDRRLQLHSAIDSYDAAVLAEDRRVQNEMDAAQTKAEKMEYDRYYSNLNRALDSKEITTHTQIESIYEMGQENVLGGDSGPALKPQDRTTMHRRLDTLNKEGATVAQYQEIIAGGLSGEYPLRRTNPDHVKAVEWLVGETGLTRDNAEELGKLTKLTGIMPDNLRDNIEGGLLSGNTDQGIAALTYIQNLQSSGSHLTSVISADTMDVANYANLLIRGGDDAEQALAQAKKMDEETTKEMKTFFRESYKTDKPDNVTALQAQLDADSTFDYEWGWNSDVTTPATMQAEYNAMVQQSYPFAKGDLALAQKLAYANVKAQWSVTGVGLSALGVGGERASKLSPEKVLQRSTKDVNLGLRAWGDTLGLNPENMILTWDKGTTKDHGYTVFMYDPETGETELADERWLADDWIKQAVTADDKQAMINAQNRMEATADEYVQSDQQILIDRVSGRDKQ